MRRWPLALAAMLASIEGAACAGRHETEPAILSLSTEVAHSGESITIWGVNFGSAEGRVTFDSAAAAVESWSSDAVVAVVPRQTRPDTLLRVERNGEASPPVPFTVFDAMANADGSPGSATTFLSLTFDDTMADQLAARPALEETGIRATFFVNSPRIGSASPDQPAYLPLADLVALQAEGHEVGGHSAQHVDLTLMSPDDVLREVCGDRASLLALGLEAQTFSYPFGALNAQIAEAVESCGYRAARGISHAAAPWPLTAPPPDPFAVPTAPPFTATTTLEQMEKAVTDVEQAGGGWVPLVFHRVCSDGCSPIAVAPELLAEFARWIQARASSGTVTRTFRQMIAGGVAAPPQPVAGPLPTSGSNLLPNGSFEEYSHGALHPDCWLLGDTGHELGHWSRIDPGHSGAAALELSAGDPVSANRRIKLMPVSGCAPSVAPGVQYRFSAWYMSEVPLRVTAAVRNPRGFWATAWAMSDVIPPSPSNWALASWTLPKIPSGRDALTVSVRLQQDDGFMILDDLSLVAP